MYIHNTSLSLYVYIYIYVCVCSYVIFPGGSGHDAGGLLRAGAPASGGGDLL